MIRAQPGRKNDMVPSYAQEWEAQNPEGAYAGMIHAIGSFMGALGSIPCCFWSVDDSSAPPELASG